MEIAAIEFIKLYKRRLRVALIEIYISFRLRWCRCTTGKYKTNQFIVLIEAEMTSREWYHCWLYQQAKSEVDMQTNRKPHLKLTWRGWQARLESHNGAAISIGVTPQDALRELSEFTGISFSKPAVTPDFRTRRVMIPD